MRIEDFRGSKTKSSQLSSKSKEKFNNNNNQVS